MKTTLLIKTFIFCFITTIFFSSCSSDDDGSTNNNDIDPITNVDGDDDDPTTNDGDDSDGDDTDTDTGNNFNFIEIPTSDLGDYEGVVLSATIEIDDASFVFTGGRELE